MILPPRRAGKRAHRIGRAIRIARPQGSVETARADSAEIRLRLRDGRIAAIAAGIGVGAVGRRHRQVRAHGKAAIDHPRRAKDRLRAIAEVFRLHILALRIGGQRRTGPAIDIDEIASRRDFERAAAIFLDRLFHELLEDRRAERATEGMQAKPLGLIIADIAARHDVRGEADEPDILGIVGRPGLARHRHRQLT